MKNIAVKINNYGHLVPHIDDRRYILSQAKADREYEVKFVKSRNIKHLGKYWVLMKAMAFHYSSVCDDDETWHYYFKEKFLPLKEMRFKGEIKLYPSSIAFDKMTQIEFDEYYKKIDIFLVENGLEIDELINTMEV